MITIEQIEVGTIYNLTIGDVNYGNYIIAVWDGKYKGIMISKEQETETDIGLFLDYLTPVELYEDDTNSVI